MCFLPIQFLPHSQGGYARMQASAHSLQLSSQTQVPHSIPLAAMTLPQGDKLNFQTQVLCATHPAAAAPPPPVSEDTMQRRIALLSTLVG